MSLCSTIPDGRVNYSYEEAEAILSLDAPGGWGRLYAGGGYLLHREPAEG